MFWNVAKTFRETRFHVSPNTILCLTKHDFMFGNTCFDVLGTSGTLPEHRQDIPEHRQDIPEHRQNIPEHPRASLEHPRTSPDHPRTSAEHPRTSPEHPRTPPEHPITVPEQRQNIAGTSPEHPRTSAEQPRTSPEHSSTSVEHSRSPQEHPKTLPSSARGWTWVARQESMFTGRLNRARPGSVHPQRRVVLWSLQPLSWVGLRRSHREPALGVASQLKPAHSSSPPKAARGVSRSEEALADVLPVDGCFSLHAAHHASRRGRGHLAREGVPVITKMVRP